MMKLMFFRGVITGLGTVIGATVVVALVYWILSLLTDTPFLGPILEYFQAELGTEVETAD
jgi:threonine/homoserine/homoserine lactone efflux protein